MTIKQRFFQLLDDISVEGIDIPVTILIFIILLIFAFRFGKKDDGKTIFQGSEYNKGTLNGHRYLQETTVEKMVAPHTQLDNEWGYNGYNIWVTSDKNLEMGYGDEGLWTGGGYEQTHYWIDPKRKFVAVIMSQMFGVPPQGYDRDNRIRGAIYEQMFED